MTRPYLARFRSETSISGAIRDALNALGYPTIRINTGTARRRGHHVQLAPPGTPDNLCMAPYLWLEVKRPGEDLNDNQRAWHAWAARHGIPVVTVETVAEAVDAVRRQAEVKP